MIYANANKCEKLLDLRSMKEFKCALSAMQIPKESLASPVASLNFVICNYSNICRRL